MLISHGAIEYDQHVSTAPINALTIPAVPTNTMDPMQVSKVFERSLAGVKQ